LEKNLGSPLKKHREARKIGYLGSPYMGIPETDGLFHGKSQMTMDDY
jgi:hypothetical protein